MTMGDHIRCMNDRELSKFISDMFYSTPETKDKEQFREVMEKVLGEEEED